MSRRRFALITAVVLIGFAWLWGCGEEETKIVTPEVAIKVTVSVTSDTLDTGERTTATLTLDTVLPGPFSYAWKSNGGTFVDGSADTTIWIAPDDDGIYTLSVVVTDGHDVGIGMADVGVGEYLPTDSPYYRGASYCSTCHDGGGGGSQYATWSHSRHAGAVQTLAGEGQDQNPVCLACHTVGSRGLDANPALHNGGYDETAVARLAGVQCENCHGPGSTHPNSEGTLPKTLSAALCASCHQGAHHPTGAEWDSSAHSGVVASPSGRAECVKCHNGVYSAVFLNDPEGFQNPTAAPTDTLPVTCSVCHDPHGNDNPSSLRNASVTDRALPNQIYVEAAGAGRLCMACHNGRRTTEEVDGQIENGSSRALGPHHSVQGDMLAGVNAYQGVADSSFAWASSRHIMVHDACVTCHTHRHPAGPGGATYTGHRFVPTVEACEECHGVINDFDEIMAKQDYDGDGTVEGVQDEVEGLAEVLKQSILDASASPEARATLEANFDGKMGDVTVSTREQRAAAYNRAYVLFDGSMGVHNTTYAVQLMQQSILYLNPTALSGAHIVRGEE